MAYKSVPQVKGLDDQKCQICQECSSSAFDGFHLTGSKYIDNPFCGLSGMLGK